MLWTPCCCGSLERSLRVRISLLALIRLIVCLIIFWSSRLRCRSRIHARAGCAILFFECPSLIVDLCTIVGVLACQRYWNPALMSTQGPPTDLHTNCHIAGAEPCNRSTEDIVEDPRPFRPPFHNPPPSALLPPRETQQMPFSPQESGALTLLFWTFAWLSPLILVEALKLF